MLMFFFFTLELLRAVVAVMFPPLSCFLREPLRCKIGSNDSTQQDGVQRKLGIFDHLLHSLFGTGGRTRAAGACEGGEKHPMPVSDRKAPYCKKNKLKAKGAGIYRLADGKLMTL